MGQQVSLHLQMHLLKTPSWKVNQTLGSAFYHIMNASLVFLCRHTTTPNAIYTSDHVMKLYISHAAGLQYLL